MVPLLSALFFLSGASALLFETLWFRQAGLALGNSIWASSLVLSGFMGGLALGNALAARYGDRVARPLQAYAAAEGVIAVAGVGLVWLLPGVGAFLGPWLGAAIDAPWIINPLRLAVAFTLLLIPATAMGVTLPLVTRVLTGAGLRFGPALGRLYGWNTLGAVAGVLVGEGFLVEQVGIRGAALVAGGIGVAAAAGAVFAGSAGARRAGPTAGSAGAIGSGTRPTYEDAGSAGARKARAAAGSAAATGRGTRPTYEDARSAAVTGRGTPPAHADAARRGTRAVYVAAFIAGFCLLALEVVWFRFLLLFVKGHALALALMLGVVLSGIALGGLAASIWLRRAPGADGAGAMLTFLAGAVCVGSYALFPRVLPPPGVASITEPGTILRVAASLTMPVAFLSGAIFTLLGAALRRGLDTDTAAAGRLTLANTFGAALGSLVAGFLLLPLIGMERSLLAVALLYGVAGFALVRTAVPRWPAYAAAAALLVSAGLFPFGSIERGLIQTSIQRWLDTDARVVAIREGLTETIVYFERLMFGRPLSRAMLTNSYSMSADGYGVRRYQKLYVYWPAAVHPGLRHALLIGYGVGNTAQAMTDSDTLETIDVVDISRDILALNRDVHPGQRVPLDDPRVRVHVEDGRYFLQATDRRFDLITGEPPPPGIAGVETLYTREYFELMRGRLAEGGIVTYWLPLSDLSDVSGRSVLAAFCAAFEDCSLWNGSGTHLMMVGTRNATGPVSDEQFARQWRGPSLGEMQALGLELPEQLGALFIGDAAYLRGLVAGIPPLVDDRPKRIEAAPSSADADARLYAELADTTAARGRFERSAFVRTLWPARLVEASLPYFDAQRVINAHMYGALLAGPPAIEDVHGILTRTPLATPVLWRLGSNGDIQRLLDGEDGRSTDPVMLFHRGVRWLSERRYLAAAAAFGEVAGSAVPVSDNAFALHIFSLCMAGQIEEAHEATRAPFEAFLQSRGLTAAAVTDAELPPFWRWMKQTFGLDPAAP